MPRHSIAPDRASTLSFWLLVGFLAILWVAGGASRADVLGQAVTRFFAWSVIVGVVFTLPRIDWRRIKGPAIILGAAALLVALQLVPLPPSLWSKLPGREMFAQAGMLIGAGQPWRPISISPSGTSNALASLTVPVAVLLLAANLTRQQHWHIGIFVLSLVGAGTIFGVAQFSGANFQNPLINSVSGMVAGNFANRNHFALFLAIGCVLALAWSFRHEAPPWKVGAAFGLIVIFILMLLATGSRSGVVLGLSGILLTFVAFRRQAAQQFMAVPRKFSIPVLVVASGVMIGAIWLSVGLDRAISVERVSSLKSETDLRLQIWPVVTGMFQSYFLVGTGYGTFDPVFRIAEPDSLLNPRYINLAHNDWLQICLEGGLVGLVLLIGALAWFILGSSRAWFSAGNAMGSSLLARVGSIIIALILGASITDYPARTPLVMALLALGAVWLARDPRGAGEQRTVGDA